MGPSFKTLKTRALKLSKTQDFLRRELCKVFPVRDGPTSLWQVRHYMSADRDCKMSIYARGGNTVNVRVKTLLWREYSECEGKDRYYAGNVRVKTAIMEGIR